MTDPEKALKLAAKTFRWYEELHRAKPDHEKADRNKELAEIMEAALQAQQPASENPVNAEMKILIKDLDITLDDLAALQCFRRKYPSWWYKIGVCDVSWDFDCAPQAHSYEMKLSKNPGDIWDAGFSYDSKISLHDAIGIVMKNIEVAFTELVAANAERKG